MRLVDLLNILSSKTNIDVYSSKKDVWRLKDEEHIISGNSFHVYRELAFNVKVMESDIIGVKVDDGDGRKMSSLHICIYNEDKK